MTTRSGVILAGGRSTRFSGADKALADVGGKPMVRRVADRLADVVDEVVVNCRADQREAIAAVVADCPTPTRIAVDDRPDEGPVAGMHTGLAAATGDYAAVLACDMPAVVPSFVGALFGVATGDQPTDPPTTPEAGPTPSGAGPPYDAVVPLRPTGWYEPLQAVYRRGPTRQACADALRRDDRKALAPLASLSWTPVGASLIEAHDAAGSFASVNTRADLEAIVERLS